MNSSASALMMQLLAQSPAWIALLVGMIVSLVFWGRYPRPAMLAFIATLLLLSATVGYPFVQSYLFRSRAMRPMTSYTNMMTLVGLVFSLVRAAAYGLLVWAVFAGRSDDVPMARGYPMGQMPPPLPFSPR